MAKKTRKPGRDKIGAPLGGIPRERNRQPEYVEKREYVPSPLLKKLRLERRVVRDPVLVAPEKKAALFAAPTEPAKPVERSRPGHLAARASLVHEAPAHSSETRKEKERPTCKDRPDSRKARKGKGGSRPFVPWCDRRS